MLYAALVLAATIAYGNLPDDWVIAPPQGAVTDTDTVPQSASASPDGRRLAVLCSGHNPPTLRLYAVPGLAQVASIPLSGAMGSPIWMGNDRIVVAGANADAVFVVDATHQTVRAISMGKGSYPVAVARDGDEFAVATDGDLSVRFGKLDEVAAAKPVKIGGHVGGLAFARDGKRLFASNRSGSDVVSIAIKTSARRTIATGLHPSAMLVYDEDLYVVQTDDDSVGVYDTIAGTRLANIFVGDVASGTRLFGVSPNAIERSGNTLYVSLGAANSIAVLENRRVAGRLPAGRYPTDAVPIGNTLYVVDGKGEGQPANPYFRGQRNGFLYYDPAIEYGSVRALSLTARPLVGNPQGARGWGERPDPIVRKDGPIRHVFFVLKENRSYDEILGDVRPGNGDPKLAWFGGRVTPNEHALARRFGLFDNTYASGEVSEAGHDWSDAAFANDYNQRIWPATYGYRVPDDKLPQVMAMIPRNGYIWQAARAAGVSFRDYGELTIVPDYAISTLKGMIDKRYPGFDLKVSDVARVREWRREFDAFVRRGTLPQLEYIWLPNDHTAWNRPGFLTPRAMVAQNDYATGLIVDAVSHSPVWKSSAIFIIEDDAQDGPDHVGAQRTTLFVVSPYSRGGLLHEHYSTVSVLRTMELILGIPPLSTYDGMAVPLYAAFAASPDYRPFEAISPEIDDNVKSVASAYGAAISARLDISRPDANPPQIGNDILAHDAGNQ